MAMSVAIVERQFWLDFGVARHMVSVFCRAHFNPAG